MNEKSAAMPELLYFGRGGTPSPRPHKHAFYQIEFCLSGRLTARTETEFFCLAPGDFWLIPPELKHHFLDSREPYEYISFKFNYNRNLPEVRGNDPVVRYFLDRILEVLSPANGFSPFTPEGKLIVESHLGGLLRHLGATSRKVPGESPFVMTIRGLVCQEGYAVNVSQLAEKLHLTRSQFQYRFAKESTGSANIKHYIEEILVSLADRHLKYSPMNLSEIAREMNFPSIYAFSRFYKRKTGMSPLQSRKKLPRD